MILGDLTDIIVSNFGNIFRPTAVHYNTRGGIPEKFQKIAVF